ncbi:DEP domain-containing protein DDB_G0279099 [Lucilia sericata]|uniref:DEP domain-containing protein DDB_G0279099 n=1 Tax=Lucilia sericata TaxID=13632 RepID=UPI0018A86364|nr:DEP domain-containing protein DDB_G0279099 [Lucilia sericata]
MFAIMENRKRPRLELLNTNNHQANETLQGVASTTTQMGTATLATIGGQSFILSNSTSNALPANILLSICDDNSDESEEYVLDHSVLAQIKQEQTVATQTNCQQIQQPTLVTTMPQFRIVNQQASKTLNTPSTLTTNNSGNSSSSSLVANSVHLPPGCEIYVIKEVIDTPKQIITESSPNNNNNNTTTSPKNLMAGNQTTIKLEPMSPLPLLRQGLNNQNLTLNNNHNNTTTSITNSSSTNSNLTSSCAADDTAKRSLILEAYKKRDDKRRATHNEVERRRRDKINSWIFKLKEMLPSEVTPANKDNFSATNQNTGSTTRLLVQQPTAFTTSVNNTTTTTRTPPSDSKSQILIKACEYIKSMQEEIKSLRECLTENENLRLSNQRLQEEINNLRAKQKLQLNNNNILLTTTTTNTTNNSNNNNNHNSDNSDDCELTLNSLNTTYANVQLFAPSAITTNQNNHHHLTGLVGLTTNSNNNTSSSSNGVNVTYAKRELIITDYVD